MLILPVNVKLVVSLLTVPTVLPVLVPPLSVQLVPLQVTHFKPGSALPILTVFTRIPPVFVLPVNTVMPPPPPQIFVPLVLVVLVLN